MRFSQRLSSHLTPEWRKYYVSYEKLKKMIYEMTGQPLNTADDDADAVQLESINVNAFLLEKFFGEIQRELDGINSFFRTREAELAHHLCELEAEVEVLMAALGNPRTQNLRSTKRKRESLKLALSEYYLNLSLLQNFQQLNHSGLRKILKKFDKVARSERGGRYFKETVCTSYFWVSKEVDRFILETETIMINKLENGNRSKAMNRLRVPPLGKKDKRSHFATLRAGWLMGIIFVSIFVVGTAIVFRPVDSWEYFTPILRGLRAGLILTLWFYGFSINTYRWQREGVNSVLIFEFNPRNYLNFVQLFEVSSLLGVVWFIGLYLFVFSYWLGIPGWVGPVVMFGLILVIFLFPFNLLYLRSRIWLGKQLGRLLLAPFFRVTFADFWIADQLNSLAVILLDVEYFWCFMIYGLHFTTPESFFQCGSVTYGLRPVVAAIPAGIRFTQCLKRYYLTREAFPHLVNAGKYSTSFFVVGFSALASGLKVSEAEQQPAGYYVAFVLWIVSAIVSSCYTFIWDIKMDWGLFEGKYKLRSELIYSKKIYYVLAVLADLILRSIWTLNISVGEAGAKLLEGNILGTILAILEVFRRFVWNFFRLENEHLNNCGQFRVVRDISVHPLNLSEVSPQDEEGAEFQLRNHFHEERRMSGILTELSSASSPILRLRRGTTNLEEPDSGVTTHHRGFHSAIIPSTIPEQDEDVASVISQSMISVHSTTL